MPGMSHEEFERIRVAIATLPYFEQRLPDLREHDQAQRLKALHRQHVAERVPR